MKTLSAVALVLVALGFPTRSNAGVCEYAKATYVKFATAAAGAGVVTGAGLKAAGIISLAHSSGTAIAATTSSGYLAGTLGAGGTAVAVLTAPATLVIGGTAVAAAGGTIAYCRYTGNKVVRARAIPAPGSVK